MFGQPPYYFRSIRKAAVAFGSLFNNMVMVKYTNDTQQEVQRLTVPLSYAHKENYINRLLDNPNLAKAVEITLPRASWEITKYSYAPSRKLNSFNSISVPGSSSGSALQQYQPVPWDIDFELSIYVRNRDDGMQLIEQILPAFNPSLTLTINYIPEMGISVDVPITLNSVDCQEQNEGDAKEEERLVIWTLTFTMQTNFYGPIISGSVITQTNTNFFGFDGVSSGPSNNQIELILAANGLSQFQFNEVAYQGVNLPQATAYGTVTTFDPVSGRLVLSATTGTFNANANVIGSISEANWKVAQTTPDVLEVVITNTVVPNTANVNSLYTINTSIKEFPDTI